MIFQYLKIRRFKYYTIYVWRETLVVGKFSKLSENHLWWNKIWQTAVWSASMQLSFGVVWHYIVFYVRSHSIASLDKRPKKWKFEKIICVIRTMAVLELMITLHPIVVVKSGWENLKRIMKQWLFYTVWLRRCQNTV